MIKKIAFSAVYVALILVFTAIPINIGSISVTLIPIIVVLATLHLGILGALVASTTWGFVSWFYSLAGLDASGLFLFPDVSVIPRIFVGGIVSLVYILIKAKNLKIWKAVVISLSAVISNTVFVTIFVFIHQAIFGQGTYGFRSPIPNLWVWITLIYILFFVEIAATTTVIVAMYQTIKWAKNKTEHAKSNEY